MLAVGPGGLDKDGKRVACSVKAGDKVLIPQVCRNFLWVLVQVRIGGRPKNFYDDEKRHGNWVWVSSYCLVDFWENNWLQNWGFHPQENILEAILTSS